MSTTIPSHSLEEIFSDKMLPALPNTPPSRCCNVAIGKGGTGRLRASHRSGPGLMGQVLKFVNSSYFGFSREITSITQALTLVGTRAITNFALWNAVFSVIPNPKFGPSI